MTEFSFFPHEAVERLIEDLHRAGAEGVDHFELDPFVRQPMPTWLAIRLPYPKEARREIFGRVNQFHRSHGDPLNQVEDTGKDYLHVVI